MIYTILRKTIHFKFQFKNGNNNDDKVKKILKNFRNFLKFKIF